MEENKKRNKLREARIKLQKTRINLQRIEKIDQSIQLSKQEAFINEQSQSNSSAITSRNRLLTYGINYVANYKGHDCQEVHGILWNRNAKAFVTWNSKNVHVWSPQTLQLIYQVDFFLETKSHGITTLSYSHSNFLYILLSRDFKAHIFNENLILISQLPLGMRILTQSRFIDSSNTMVASGVEGIFLYKLLVKGATDKQLTHKLDPLGTKLNIKLKLFQRLEGCQSWVKGLQVDEEHNLVFAWSLTIASFYKLSDFSLHFSFQQLIEEKDTINDFLFMPKYRYIVMCSEAGKLNVYKWSSTPDLFMEFKDVGVNQKPIKALTRHPDRVNQFISASLDQTIRIWCLEKLTCCYVLRVPFEIRGISFLHDFQFALFQERQIQIGRLNDIVYLMFKSDTKIKSIGQCFMTIEQRRQNHPYAIFVQLKDQSFKILDAKAQVNDPTLLDDNIKSTIYPPPQAENIRVTRFCSILKQLIVSVDSGTIYFYRLKHLTSVMVNELNLRKFRDQENQKLDQRLTTFELGCGRPPRYDCQRYVSQQEAIQRKQTWYQKNFNGKANNSGGQKNGDVADGEETSQLETDSEVAELLLEDRYLIMGFDQGQVIFFDLMELEKGILARYDVCRHKILMIREIFKFHKYLFYEEGHVIRLCDLTPTGTQQLHTFNLYRPLFDLIAHGTYVYLAFEHGDVEFLQVVSLETDPDLRQQLEQTRCKLIENEHYELSHREQRAIETNQIRCTGSHGLIRFKFGRGFDHEIRLTAVTLSTNSGHLATADESCLIKVWDQHKLLVREIQFPPNEPIKALCFLDKRGDLIVGHGQRQSIVFAAKYLKGVRPVDRSMLYRKQLQSFAQEVSNERMYSLYVKSVGGHQIFASQKNQLKNGQLTEKKGERGSLEECKVGQILSRDDEVRLAEKQSKVLAAQAIAEEVKRLKLLEIARIQKELKKKQRKAAKKSVELQEAYSSRNTAPAKSLKSKQQDSKSEVVLPKCGGKPSTGLEQTRRATIKDQNSNNSSISLLPSNITVVNQQQSTPFTDLKPLDLSQTKTPAKHEQQKPHMPLTSVGNLSTRRQYSQQDFTLYSNSAVVNFSNQLSSMDAIKRNNTASTSAVPREVIQENYDKIAQGKLHPRRPKQSIRRDITEKRIQDNVRQFNSTVVVNSGQDLFIGRQPDDQLTPAAQAHYLRSEYGERQTQRLIGTGNARKRNFSFEDLKSVVISLKKPSCKSPLLVTKQNRQTQFLSHQNTKHSKMKQDYSRLERKLMNITHAQAKASTSLPLQKQSMDFNDSQKQFLSNSIFSQGKTAFNNASTSSNAARHAAFVSSDSRNQSVIQYQTSLDMQNTNKSVLVFSSQNRQNSRNKQAAFYEPLASYDHYLSVQHARNLSNNAAQLVSHHYGSLPLLGDQTTVATARNNPTNVHVNDSIMSEDMYQLQTDLTKAKNQIRAQLRFNAENNKNVAKNRSKLFYSSTAFGPEQPFRTDQAIYDQSQQSRETQEAKTYSQLINQADTDADSLDQHQRAVASPDLSPLLISKSSLHYMQKSSIKVISKASGGETSRDSHSMSLQDRKSKESAVGNGEAQLKSNVLVIDNSHSSTSNDNDGSADQAPDLMKEHHSRSSEQQQEVVMIVPKLVEHTEMLVMTDTRTSQEEKVMTGTIQQRKQGQL